MLKQLLASPLVQLLLGRSFGLYMSFVGATTRWRMVNREVIERAWAEKISLVGCIWHGRFAQVHKLWAFGPDFPKAKMLISQSREGGVILHASRAVGAEVIRGSAAKRGQGKGGLEAMRAMIDHLRGGGVMCITPDGPRGPRMRVGMGPVRLAQLSGSPLYPVTWSTSAAVVLQSWDRFVLPLPFGRGVLVWGEPIKVAREASGQELEAARLALELELNRISAHADRLCGRPVIEPADPRRAELGAADAAARP